MKQTQILRRLFVGCVAVFMFSSVVTADSGRFEVINASARYEDASWLVDARVELELSDTAVNALQSGVSLRIIYQYEFIKRRRFWPDQTLATAEQAFELQYFSLSERYRIRSIPDNFQQSYATLFSALRYLGQVRDFSLSDDVLIEDKGSYYMTMRAVLDQGELPGPLQVFAFWRDDFALESQRYRWKPN